MNAAISYCLWVLCLPGTVTLFRSVPGMDRPLTPRCRMYSIDNFAGACPEPFMACTVFFCAS